MLAISEIESEYTSNMSDLIRRNNLFTQLNASTKLRPISAILGPRQCGKTTLAKQFLKGNLDQFFDLEDVRDRARLADPYLALANLEGLVVLDEVQRMPELFEALRVLADRRPNPATFILLGSASPDLSKRTETLAGRITYLHMSGFGYDEVSTSDLDRLWLRGGFPDSYLAESDETSYVLRKAFHDSFILRDLQPLAPRTSLTNVQRFWQMLAHMHGQTWNASTIGSSLDIDGKTARHYLEMLKDTFMVRILEPYAANIGKRLRKAPKVYIRDTGILHYLLQIESRAELDRHLVLGSSWEGFVVEHVIRILDLDDLEVFTWQTAARSEIELIMRHRGHLFGVEVKHSTTPKVTRSMRLTMDDLSLKTMFLIYRGDEIFELDKGIIAVGWKQLEKLPELMKP